MKRKQGKHVHKKTKQKPPEGVGQVGTNVPRPPDLLNHAGDFSITPVTCLLVFGNSLDVHELINVTFGGGGLESSRVKARVLKGQCSLG